MRSNERTDAGRGAAVPAVSRPVNSTPEEYEAALWRATDASLRRDPERWRFPSSGDFSYSTAARAGLPDETGLRAYVQDADDRRAAQAAAYRESGRRKQATRRARSLRAQEGAQRGWETRRARAQAAARTHRELG